MAFPVRDINSNKVAKKLRNSLYYNFNIISQLFFVHACYFWLYLLMDFGQ